MNKEEFINKLKVCYFGEIDAFNEIVGIYDELQKKIELGDHYKHLYSEVKKQKDDVVEYIKTQQIIFANYDIVIEEQLDNILRMLGEIDE